jgi:predicted TIM-barrel fold metal-dependent hydrolase
MAQMMISADDHLDLGYLPRDLWLERLPKSLREKAPRVEDRGDDGDLWICDDQVWGDWRLGRWSARKKRPITALDRGGIVDMSRPTTPNLRLEDMDRDGIEASVMFPPIFGLTFTDRKLKLGCVTAYNDWAAEFASTDPKRLIPVAQMFPDDAEASTAELLRIAKLGLRQVSFLVGTVKHEMYMEPAWDAFWAAAEETGTVVSYHVGGGVRGSFPSDARKPVFGMGIGHGGTTFMEPFAGLFIYRVLERHPGLRFVLAESGTGWIPYVVQEMDHYYHAAIELGVPDGGPLKELPSETFRRQVWATYQEDLVGLHLIEFFGEGHMMWASDYPHPDSTWPFSQETVAKETAHLPPDLRTQIVHGNAKAFYNL